LFTLALVKSTLILLFLLLSYAWAKPMFHLFFFNFLFLSAWVKPTHLIINYLNILMRGFYCCIILSRFLIFFQILRGLGPRCLYLFNCKSFSRHGSCVGWTHVLFYFLFWIIFDMVRGLFYLSVGLAQAFFVPVVIAVFSCSDMKYIFLQLHELQSLMGHVQRPF